nr:MAG: replication initiation protein [Microvirus Sku113]
MCYNPVTIRASINNIYTLHRRRLRKMFTDYDVEQFIDYQARNDYSDNMKTFLVPCGKCFQCRTSRVNEWIIRCLHELPNYNGLSIMVTLTYSNEYLTNPSLDYKDCQNFLKRLRKKLSGRKIAYLAVGEYGFKSFRKHFHLVILGMTKKDYTLIKECWPFGYVYVKNCDLNAIRYILKYSFKQQFTSNKDYESINLTKPMFHCSKGFGKNVCLRDFSDFLSQGYFYYNGFKFPIPRYYRKLLIEKGIIHNTFFFDQLDFKEIFMNNIIHYLGEDSAFNVYKHCFGDKDFSTVTFSDFSLYKEYLKCYMEDYNKLKYEKFLKNFFEKI